MMNSSFFSSKSNARQGSETSITIDRLRVDGVFLWHVQMPHKIKAYTKKYQEYYLIYINSALCQICASKALKHELCHIYLGHLDDDLKSVEEKEAEVSRMIGGD